MKKWKVMKAHKEGFEIEGKRINCSEWIGFIDPKWDWINFKYRVKKVKPTIIIWNKNTGKIPVVDSPICVVLLKSLMGNVITYHSIHSIQWDNTAHFPYYALIRV